MITSRVREIVAKFAWNGRLRSEKRFVEAVRCLDLKKIQVYATTTPEKLLSAALACLAQGEYLHAQRLMQQISDHPPFVLTDLCARLSKQISSVLHFEAEYYGPSDAMRVVLKPSDRATICSDAGETSVCLDAHVAETGMFILTVAVNGQSGNFLLDTGCSYVSLSDAFARRAHLIESDLSSQSITSTKHRSEVKQTLADEVAIGPFRFENLFVVTFGPHESQRLSHVNRPEVQIDGIVGWNVLGSLSTVFDSRARTVTLSNRASKRSDNPNLHWFGFPCVRTPFHQRRCSNLWFALDTGSTSTYFCPSVRRTGKVRSVPPFTCSIAGASGDEDIRVTEIAENVPIELPSAPFLITNSVLHGPQFPFVDFDGVLGMDLTKRGQLVVDGPGGVCDVLPY